MSRQPERTIGDIEQINMLKADNNLLKLKMEENIKKLEDQQDYNQIKNDLISAQDSFLEVDKENKILIDELEETSIALEEALIKVEMFHYEMEEKYLQSEESQEQIEDYQKAYQLLKKKLKVFFEISSEEKFEMENKISGLNNKLQELQAQKANVMDSLEVQQEIKRRDHNIDELMKMIDSYKDSQKMIEMMTEKNSKIENINAKFQEDLKKEKEKCQKLEEEFEAEKQYMEEQELAFKDVEEELKLYEEIQLEWEEKEDYYNETILKYKEKIDGLESERNDLEVQKFESKNEKDLYVNYLQDANKQQFNNTEEFKNSLLTKYEARYWLFKAESQRVILEALPEKIQANLRVAQLDTYELLEINDIRLNCSIEILFHEYVLNDNIKIESPNLFNNAKDLLLDLLNLKCYLGLCKRMFRLAPSKEENSGEENELNEKQMFLDSKFYKEIVKNLINIENLYITLTRGELSSSYCMSHFSEAKFKLEEMISGFEMNEKIRILRILTKGGQQMVMLNFEMGDKLDGGQKNLMNQIVSKLFNLFHLYERIDSFDVENNRKIDTYESKTYTSYFIWLHQGNKPLLIFKIF